MIRVMESSERLMFWSVFNFGAGTERLLASSRTRGQRMVGGAGPVQGSGFTWALSGKVVLVIDQY